VKPQATEVFLLIFVPTLLCLDNWLEDSGFDFGQEKKFFPSPKCPDLYWGSPTIFFNGLRDSFPVDKGGGDYVNGG
jgi:hypothetical protein